MSVPAQSASDVQRSVVPPCLGHVVPLTHIDCTWFWTRPTQHVCARLTQVTLPHEMPPLEPLLLDVPLLEVPLLEVPLPDVPLLEPLLEVPLLDVPPPDPVPLDVAPPEVPPLDAPLLEPPLLEVELPEEPPLFEPPEPPLELAASPPPSSPSTERLMGARSTASRDTQAASHQHENRESKHRCLLAAECVSHRAGSRSSEDVSGTV